MSTNENTCPHCGAPIEGTALDGWIVYQCGRTNDTLDADGFNACDWAQQARADGERAATERIAAWLDTYCDHAKPGDVCTACREADGVGCIDFAEMIRRGEHDGREGEAEA